MLLNHNVEKKKKKMTGYEAGQVAKPDHIRYSTANAWVRQASKQQQQQNKQIKQNKTIAVYSISI